MTDLPQPSPDSISELFSRDPFLYSEKDIADIIHALRDMRVQHAKNEVEGKAAGTRTKSAGALPKPKATKEELSSLSLDDLLKV